MVPQQFLSMTHHCCAHRTAGVAPGIVAAVVMAALFTEGESPSATPAAAVGASLARWMGKSATLLPGAFGAAGAAATGAPMMSNLMFAGMQQVREPCLLQRSATHYCGSEPCFQSAAVQTIATSETLRHLPTSVMMHPVRGICSSVGRPGPTS